MKPLAPVIKTLAILQTRTYREQVWDLVRKSVAATTRYILFALSATSTRVLRLLPLIETPEKSAPLHGCRSGQSGRPLEALGSVRIGNPISHEGITKSGVSLVATLA